MKKLILIASSILVSTFLHAQKTDFSGTFVFASKEHITGPEYGNALPTKFIVQQSKDSLKIESSYLGADGNETTSRQTFAMNGKSTSKKSVSSNRTYQYNLKWSDDKKSIILTTVFSMPGDESKTDFTRIETWTLSADGKQLNLDKRSEETRSETWEVKAVFDK